MTAGIPITRSSIDSQAGVITQSVFASMAHVLQFKQWLDTVSVDDLQNDYAYSAEDANMLKSAVADLADLAGVFAGSAANATLPYDYRTFSKNLLGVGTY